VQAAILNPGNELVESEKAEIAVYDALHSTSPTFEALLFKFLSKEQEGQEFKNFAQFVPRTPKNVTRVITIAHGSTSNLKLKGGSNLWQDSTKYFISGSSTPEGLKIEQSYLNLTRSSVDIQCPLSGTSDKLKGQQSYWVTIVQSNKASVDLMEPFVH